MRLATTLVMMSCLLGAESLRVPVWPPTGTQLTEEQLAASVGVEPVPVVRVQGPGSELLVLLVLDMVGQLNKIELAREGLVQAVRESPPNVHFAVLRAQGGLKVLQDPTDDLDEIEDVIREFPVSGTPGLLETIEPASALADSILSDSPVRIAVLYVTDSEIDEYREDFTNPVVNRSDRGDLSRRFPEVLVRDRVSRLATKLAASQAPIFVVHLDYSTSRSDEAYQGGILRMTATTGGDAIFCRSDAEIPGAMDTMMQRIVEHYAVDVEVPAGRRELVEVSLESPSAGALAYRTRYDVGLE